MTYFSLIIVLFIATTSAQSFPEDFWLHYPTAQFPSGQLRLQVFPGSAIDIFEVTYTATNQTLGRLNGAMEGSLMRIGTLEVPGVFQGKGVESALYHGLLSNPVGSTASEAAMTLNPSAGGGSLRALLADRPPNTGFAETELMRAQNFETTKNGYISASQSNEMTFARPVPNPGAAVEAGAANEAKVLRNAWTAEQGLSEAGPGFLSRFLRGGAKFISHPAFFGAGTIAGIAAEGDGIDDVRKNMAGLPDGVTVNGRYNRDPPGIFWLNTVNPVAVFIPEITPKGWYKYMETRFRADVELKMGRPGKNLLDLYEFRTDDLKELLGEEKFYDAYPKYRPWKPQMWVPTREEDEYNRMHDKFRNQFRLSEIRPFDRKRLILCK